MAALICEVFDVHLEPIYENIDGNKTLFIEGVFLQSNLKNKNGRIYPTSVMEREVENYRKTHIDTNRAWGELNHPPTPTINLDRVSHRCVGLHREGDNWIGKARIVDTPMGKIARQLIESGGELGTSSRGLGSLRKRHDGIMEVGEDFRLMVAGDIVSDPSAPEAWLSALRENENWVYNAISDNWIAQNTTDKISESIKKDPNPSAEKTLLMFEAFMNALANKN